MNSYQATGRLTRDPELRELPSGDSVCEMRLAIDGMGRGDRSAVGYLDVSEYGKPGEASHKVLSKGWLVAFDGRLEYHEWDGEHGKRHDVRGVGKIEFLAAPKGARNGDTTGDDIPVDAGDFERTPVGDDDIAF